MANRVAIGIDLGTSNSCVAAVRNGRVEVIANDQGSRVTPSCVAFTDEERLIGEAAKAQATFNSKNTAYDVKRIIGRKFNDESIQNGIKYWPFTVVNHEGNPFIEAEYKNELKTYTPEEISAMVLGKMKDTAEVYLGCPVKDAVITVPAYFNDSQRQATIDAGTIAGLNVLGILNEPTAAAIAYGFDKEIEEKRNILIYDLGGGTLDVVVMTIENGVFGVLAVGGNTDLGGADFDNLLVEYFAEEFKKNNNIDILQNHSSSARLRKECEAMKRRLSSSKKDTIQIESLSRGIDFRSSLSRVRFEMICENLFDVTMEVVDAVLKDSKLTKSQIHEVVLVGGSTRIPKIQNLMETLFAGKKINRTINPDEAVAYGAALHAAMLSRDNTVERIELQDVVPLSLCVEDSDGGVTVIIPRNTKIPATVTHERTTAEDYQTRVEFCIYEGEHKIAKDNCLLGWFQLDNIEYAPKHEPIFELTYDIDLNGILHVSAIDIKTGSSNDITVTANKGRLKEEDIERMVEEAKQFDEDALDLQDRRNAHSALEAVCHKVQAEVQHQANEGRISGESQSSVLQICNETLDWANSNEDAPIGACVEETQNLISFCEFFGVNLNLDSDDASGEVSDDSYQK